MQFIPVLSSSGQPLMPCHPARARELIRKGRAVRHFNRGVFFIRLLDRAVGELQPIAVGVDPGSLKEGFSVKSASHTFLDIQADAVTWVSEHMKTRRDMRHTRRSRKTPYRPCRPNRRQGQPFLPPSTRARWGWKLRVCRWLAKLYPVTVIVVEDIAAKTRPGQPKWNRRFSPLEAGKSWFYHELEQIARVETYQGFETKAERDLLGLKKCKTKTADRWDAHCVDAWVLARKAVGGAAVPDNTAMLYLTPLRFHRRQLHRLQPEKGGIRKPYGGTLSQGFKRGSWVKHRRYGVCYIGGAGTKGISLHDLATGKRLTQYAKPTDLTFLCTASWRLRQETAQSSHR